MGAMTEPTPAPEPLLTKARLATWAQENPLSDPDLADLIIDAVSTLLWLYGDSAWTATTMPARARDIGYIVAKDYYLNPRQLRQETIGPLQESVDDSVLGGISLTEAQQAELAALADSGPAIGGSSLWALSTTRGDETTMYPGRAGRGGNVVLWDSRGGWPIEYLAEEDGGAFGLGDEA